MSTCHRSNAATTSTAWNTPHGKAEHDAKEARTKAQSRGGNGTLSRREPVLSRYSSAAMLHQRVTFQQRADDRRLTLSRRRTSGPTARHSRPLRPLVDKLAGQGWAALSLALSRQRTCCCGAKSAIRPTTTTWISEALEALRLPLVFSGNRVCP